MNIKVFTIRVVVHVQDGDPSDVAERAAYNALSTLQDVEPDNLDPNVCFGIGASAETLAADEANMEDYKADCEKILAEDDDIGLADEDE